MNADRLIAYIESARTEAARFGNEVRYAYMCGVLCAGSWCAPPPPPQENPMAALPDDFKPTELGELPNPLLPLADNKRGGNGVWLSKPPEPTIPFADVPVPASWPPRRQAPPPVKFPTPEELLAERERRDREERLRVEHQQSMEQEIADEIATAYAEGITQGEEQGFRDGTHWGMFVGGVIGIAIGAAGVAVSFQFGYRWFA